MSFLAQSGRPARSRGVTLIVVLGALMLIALLATSFATLSVGERRIAHNFADAVRARSVAGSGIEEAVAKLQALDFFNDTSWRYPGVQGVEDSTTLSFQMKGLNGNGKTLKIDGKVRGISQEMSGGTYGPHLDAFSLRVRDANDLLNVNDGVEFGPTHSVSLNLLRMLKLLGTIRGVPSSVMEKIVNLRPAWGFRSKLEVRSLLAPDYASYDRIKEFITVHAWKDKHVAEPVPLSADVLSSYASNVKYYRGTPPIYRYGRNKNAKGGAINESMLFYPAAPWDDDRIKVYGLDELNPQWIEVTTRAPVNINGAPRDLLRVLLSGLQGFFRVERRQVNPTRALASTTVLGHLGAPGSYWTGDKLDYSTKTNMGSLNRDDDDIGLLYATDPISTASSGTEPFVPNSSSAIADEIIACRTNKVGHSGFDYSRASFGGQFRNWAQFNKFCDNLVRIGVIKDTRNCFFDIINGSATPSAIQSAVASRAIADALKANFNPNLHLNELNPDANLALLVDKTDLLTHSTEFCFFPMGTFEIESIGRVLSKDPASKDNFLTVSESKLSVAVKLWDAYRDTSQKDFYAGDIRAADLKSKPAKVYTNSNAGLEIGPEPDNGSAPSANLYSGYLALATVGGVGVEKQKTELRSTPDGATEFGEWMHAHFALDFDAHYHKYGSQFRKEANRNSVTAENTARNIESKTETVRGPYDPMWPTPDTHRLCRCFTSGSTVPSLSSYAPSNLHVDGGYSERHSAPGYVVMYGVSLQHTLQVVTNIKGTGDPS